MSCAQKKSRHFNQGLFNHLFFRFLFCFLVLFLILLQIDSPAQDNPVEVKAAEKKEPASGETDALEGKKISLNLRNIDIIEALKFFAMKTGLNLIPTSRVSGRVTLTVELAAVKDVFDIMLRSNNLAYDKRGTIYNVMTEDEYRRFYGRSFSDTRKVKVLRLKYAIPEQAFTMLDTIKSSIGRLLVEPETGTILIMDTAENIKASEEALAALEKENIVQVFSLKYAKAKDVEEQLKAQLDAKKVGSVRSDERTNQVIVQTLPERMKNIEQLITSLDKKTKAVLVDTKIIQLKLSDKIETGIQWEGLFAAASQFGTMYMGANPFAAVQSGTAAWRSRSQVLQDMAGDIGSYPSSGFTSDYKGSSIKPGEALHFGIIDGKRDFDVMMRFLQTLGNTKILSNPTITIVNNQEGKIHVGERRAYVTTTTTTGASTTTVSEDVTFVDVGVRLSIVPLINEDGYVTMKIRPEISSVIGEVPTSSNNVIPIIDTSMAETTVIAKDGATIIIGGLAREEKIDDTYQVPVLGQIPGLGFFFRSKVKKVEKSELLIFLTPYIFEGDKLITPKEKDLENFGIKPVKKFDVFKEELPDQKLPGPAPFPGDLFTPKILKPSSGVSLDEEPENQQPSVTKADLAEKKDKLVYKGLKAEEISNLAQEDLSAGIPREPQFFENKRELYTPQPKGYRAYN
jgi:general secretion pathway protein D